jgi:enamine deaminase RidA (YjgF/YER057c/UK114 family)
MSTVDERIAALGLELPAEAKPAGAYVPAIITGNLVFTAGQLPWTNGVLPATGKVGAEVTPEDAKEYARACVLNGLAAARGVLGSLDRIVKVVKVVGFVSSDPAFTGQPGVVNGASELLGEIFGEPGAHARSAVGVAVLPLDTPVEIEFVFEFE